eukprot:1497994-Prymnesium_polylepis.3
MQRAPRPADKPRCQRERAGGRAAPAHRRGRRRWYTCASVSTEDVSFEYGGSSLATRSDIDSAESGGG